MYAHVITYRLGDSDETNSEMRWALETGNVISDQTARTIASWWHSPRQNSIVALSHGLPFNTEDLIDEISREIGDADDEALLIAWAENLEEILAD